MDSQAKKMTPAVSHHEPTQWCAAKGAKIEAPAQSAWRGWSRRLRRTLVLRLRWGICHGYSTVALRRPEVVMDHGRHKKKSHKVGKHISAKLDKYRSGESMTGKRYATKKKPKGRMSGKY